MLVTSLTKMSRLKVPGKTLNSRLLETMPIKQSIKINSHKRLSQTFSHLRRQAMELLVTVDSSSILRLRRARQSSTLRSQIKARWRLVQTTTTTTVGSKIMDMARAEVKGK